MKTSFPISVCTSATASTEGSVPGFDSAGERPPGSPGAPASRSLCEAQARGAPGPALGHAARGLPQRGGRGGR